MKRSFYVILAVAIMLIGSCSKNDNDNPVLAPYTFTSSGNLYNLQSIAFTTNAPAGLTYNWSFGDGTTANYSSPTHIYKDSGTYDVTLVVNGDVGHKAHKTLHILITPALVYKDFIPGTYRCHLRCKYSTPASDSFYVLGDTTVGVTTMDNFTLRLSPVSAVVVYVFDTSTTILHYNYTYTVFGNNNPTYKKTDFYYYPGNDSISITDYHNPDGNGNLTHTYYYESF